MLSRLSDDWQAHIGRLLAETFRPISRAPRRATGSEIQMDGQYTEPHGAHKQLRPLRRDALRLLLARSAERERTGTVSGKKPGELRALHVAEDFRRARERKHSAASVFSILPGWPDSGGRGARGNQEKPPWKDATPPQGVLETSFPALLGESVAPFRAPDPRRAVVPWNPERGDLMDAETAGLRGNARPAPRFLQAETLWEAHRHGQISYRDQAVRPVSVAPTRVAYTKAGTNLAAAVVQDEEAIADHKLYWEPADSLAEARYLSSTAPRCRPA